MLVIIWNFNPSCPFIYQTNFPDFVNSDTSNYYSYLIGVPEIFTSYLEIE